MTRPLRISLAAVLTLALAALGACGDDGNGNGDDDATATTGDEAELTVTDVWARPAPDLAASDRSAVYMQITAGSEGDELLSASVPADVAETVELHETRMVDDSDDGMDGMDGMDGDDAGMNSGVMEMVEVDTIVIPADETVSLEPGGLHVMLLDLQTELEPGDTVEVTLVFAEAGEMTVTAEVREL